MTTQHTQGPWAIDLRRHIVANGSTVATCHHDASQLAVAIDRETCYANASLIAAAPELLEACEQALADLNALADYKSDDATDATILTLEAALAKAKGK